MFDWDDLRVFLAAARSPSLSSAAARAGVDAATVGRRIARLEDSLKSTLLVRSARGLSLTPAGARLFDTALAAECAMLRVQGEDEEAAGAVRLSAAEGFGTAVLAPALADLRRRRPGLRVELAATQPFLSPGRREVDIAVTLSAEASPRLFVEPLTEYQLALYAAPEYLRRRAAPGSVEALSGHDLVGYVEDLIYAPELRYLDEIGSGLRPAIASSSIRAQREIIAAGGGIGVLPCFLAAGLTPVLEEEVLLTRRFWVSMNADGADTRRLKVVRRWLSDVVLAKRSELLPFAPATGTPRVREDAEAARPRS